MDGGGGGSNFTCDELRTNLGSVSCLQMEVFGVGGGGGGLRVPELV